MNSESKENRPGPQSAPENNLPPVGEQVWVQCGDYRTLAFRDRDGSWRAVATNEKLTVTKVLGQ